MPAVSPQVLEGAREAFSRHGFHGATLDRIAQEAGVSRVTLHRRGIGKDEILAALAEEATADYRESLWPALTAPGSARERIELALCELCNCAERQLPLLLALRAQADAIFHEPGEEEEALTRDVFTEPFERLLRDGAADGTLRVADPHESATTLFNLVGWTYVHLRTGHRWAPERARAAVLDVALRGIVGSDSRREEPSDRRKPYS